jgi:hypothetical protein
MPLSSSQPASSLDMRDGPLSLSNRGRYRILTWFRPDACSATCKVSAPASFLVLSEEATSRLAAGDTIFLPEIRQPRVVEHAVRQQLLQLGILAFQPPRPLGVGDLNPAVFGFPIVEACLADSVLAARFIIWPFPQGQNPIRSGVQWGNVRSATVFIRAPR